MIVKIQHRRGAYADYDPTKVLPGELVVVQSDDPATDDGKSIYIGTAGGTIKRLATAEEIVAYNAQGAAILAQVQQTATNVQNYAQTAQTKASEANTSAQSAAQSKSAIDTIMQTAETTINEYADDAKDDAIDGINQAYEERVDEINDKIDQLVAITTDAEEIATSAKNKVDGLETDLDETTAKVDSNTSKVNGLQTEVDSMIHGWYVDVQKRIVFTDSDDNPIGNPIKGSDLVKPATTQTLGEVIVGEGLNVKADGTLSTDDFYMKPASGIPKSDFASDVQTSLGKADTALQEHQDISGKANIADVQAALSTKADVSDGEAIETELATKADAEDLNEAVDDVDQLKNALIVNSAEGAIASFPDGGDGFPVRDLKVQLEPVQDLHGYDNPWPAGGGKNLLQNTATTQTVNGVTFIVNADGTVSISGTATAGVILRLNSVTLPEGSYIVSGGISENCYINVAGKVNSFTSDSSFSVASGGETLIIAIYIVSGTTASGTFKPMIRLASESDATFSPYSNICPISGRTGVTVTRTGKNLLDFTEITPTYPGADPITKQVNIPQDVTFQFTASSDYANSNNYWLVYVARQDNTRTYIIPTAGQTVSRTITGTSENPITEVYIRNASVTAGRVYNLQLELGSTATAYEPYAGNTYDITFPTEAGTVYGGELTVNEDGTGSLVVDRVRKKLNELATRSVTLKNGIAVASIQNFANQSYFGANGFDYSKITCTVLETKTNSDVWTGNVGISSWNQDLHMIIGIPIQEATVQAVSSWLASFGDDVIVIWPLFEPITYTLTAAQVTTLLGTNNVWSDADSVSVDYVADTKLYIEQLTEPDSDMIADMNITSGRYFMVGNSLYLATANIANGAAITVGVNCTRTNLAEALNAINA